MTINENMAIEAKAFEIENKVMCVFLENIMIIEFKLKYALGNKGDECGVCVKS